MEKLPHARRDRLLRHGYQIRVVYLKLFEKVYAPLTAGTLEPVCADHHLLPEQTSRLDRLYTADVTAPTWSMLSRC